MRPLARRSGWALGAAVLLFAGWVLAVNFWADQTVPAMAPNVPLAVRVERGAYLARAGNCAACHTARGGVAWAGGRPIETPFGTVVSSNLTSDPHTGLGQWTFADFWRALHHGRSRDGRLLYPVFPYPNYSLVAPEDAADLWAYLKSLPPVEQTNREHALQWPYRTQAALAVWRALYFKPQRWAPDNSHDTAWNRGAYLVNGLGHCNNCHGQRNAMGANSALAQAHEGSRLPLQRWLAPALGGSIQPDGADDTMLWLKTGISARHGALGPMAEVVAGSTQHLSQADLMAVTTYLQTLPAPANASDPKAQAEPAQMSNGARVYTDHCATCHGQEGQGAPNIYPALKGNRTVNAPSISNLVQVITKGGFPPATAANPRPYGMPAFDLSHAELAALATWLRASWGHNAPPVSEVDVLLSR